VSDWPNPPVRRRTMTTTPDADDGRRRLPAAIRPIVPCFFSPTQPLACLTKLERKEGSYARTARRRRTTRAICCGALCLLPLRWLSSGCFPCRLEERVVPCLRPVAKKKHNSCKRPGRGVPRDIHPAAATRRRRYSIARFTTTMTTKVTSTAGGQGSYWRREGSAAPSGLRYF
jgi:hypothetical protein